MKETDFIRYIISVRGEGISTYRIQLGYTTNNQFTYTLYHATDDVSPEDSSAVMYVPNDREHLPIAYYKPVGTAIAGRYLNKASVSEMLANAMGDYHTLTYDTHESVQKYAEPIYWQTNSAIPAGFVVTKSDKFTKVSITEIIIIISI